MWARRSGGSARPWMPARRAVLCGLCVGQRHHAGAVAGADILAREPHSRFTLIYGNRSIARTMFLEETLALKNRYIERFSVHFVMSREPQHDRMAHERPDRCRQGRELAREIPEYRDSG